MSFTFSSKKNKIFVKEGSSGFNITYKLDPLQVSCQCTSKPLEICKHLQRYYTDELGIKAQYIYLLSVPRIKTWFQEECDGKPGTVNRYCSDFLECQKEGCVICMQPYIPYWSKETESTQFLLMACLYQCPQCLEPYHIKCFRQWKKDCPRCKFNQDINQGRDDNVEWPKPQPPKKPEAQRS